MKAIALTMLLVLSVANRSLAQEIAGRVEGRIVTASGAPLAGVEITVTSPNLLGERVVATDARGRYFAPVLPVGVYRLRARKIGFRPIAVDAIPVRLGVTTQLDDYSLDATAVELPAVLVSARIKGYDPNNTAQQLILGKAVLARLPLERNFREILLLSPSGSPSYLGAGGTGAGINRDGINMSGATGYENTFFVDGINTTSPIRGETSIDLPYNFIQEIDMRTGGSRAEDGQALGGVVNVVTPTGGNRMRGQVFGFFSSDALEAAPRQVNGFNQSGFTFRDAGSSLSGPIVRDRLWYSASYNGNSERRRYRFDFGELAETKSQHLFSGKLSWLVGATTSAALTILGDPSTSTPLAGPLFGNGVPRNAEVLQRRDAAGGIGLSARAHHQLTPTILIESSLAQMSRLEWGEPATPSGRTPVVIDQVDGTLYGGHGFEYRFDSRRRSARFEASWQRGTHALKGGAQFEELYGDITMGLTTITRVGENLYELHTSQGRNGRGHNRQPTLYVQDGWQVTPRLLANAGVRWSQQDVVAAESNPANRRFRVRDGAQPRLGIVYQPGPLGTQRLFASFARATEQLPIWGHQAFAAGAESLGVFPQDPRFDRTGGQLREIDVYGAGYPVDPSGVRAQAQDTWSAGYNRRLNDRWHLTAHAMHRSLVRALQAGLDTGNVYMMGNPGFGAMSQFPRASRTHDAFELSIERAGNDSSWYRVSYVLSRTRGNDPGLYGSDWRLGFTNFGPRWILPVQFDNATGLLPNDRTHLLKAMGSRNLTSDLSVGATLVVGSGTPLSQYGAIPGLGPPWRGFATQRGTAGRTPAVWDLGVRFAHTMPATRTRVLLDVQHVGSPRTAVDYEQTRFGCLDANGQQSCPNIGYGRVLQYQRPMMARLGFETSLTRDEREKSRVTRE